MTTQTSMEFFFRAEKLKDDAGKDLGTSKKLPAFKADLPVPTAEELIAFLVNPESKEAEYIVGLAAEAVYQTARQQINDWRANNQTAEEVSPAAIDLAKLDFSVIATTPSESAGRQGVSDEAWAAFYETYATVMKAAGEGEKQAAAQVLVITNKFKTVKDVKVLERMVDKLSMFAASAGEEVLREHFRAFTLTQNRLQAAITKAGETTMEDIG